MYAQSGQQFLFQNLGDETKTVDSYFSENRPALKVINPCMNAKYHHVVMEAVMNEDAWRTT